MIPGPNIIIKCPSCGKLHQRKSIISGNTCGAIFFSDGSRIAPMLPDFPYFVKCQKSECGVYFKIIESVIASKCDVYFNNIKSVIAGVVSRNETRDNLYMPMVSFMSFYEYLDCIDTGLFNSGKKGSREWEDDLLSLRISLWRALNIKKETIHQIIAQDLRFSIEDDEPMRKLRTKYRTPIKTVYEINCNEILSLLDKKSDDESLLIKAELYRNIGNFDMCESTLKLLKEPDEYIALITAIKKACGEKIPFTVRVEEDRTYIEIRI